MAHGRRDAASLRKIKLYNFAHYRTGQDKIDTTMDTTIDTTVDPTKYLIPQRYDRYSAACRVVHFFFPREAAQSDIRTWHVRANRGGSGHRRTRLLNRSLGFVYSARVTRLSFAVQSRILAIGSFVELVRLGKCNMMTFGL